MSDTYADLVRRYTEARIAELEREIAEIVNGDREQLAPQLEAVLSGESDGTPTLLDAFADHLKPEEPDGPYVEALGRKVSRAEAEELLRRWDGTLTEATAPKLDPADADATAAHLDRLRLADAEWQEQQATESARRLAEWEAEWRRSHKA